MVRGLSFVAERTPSPCLDSLARMHLFAEAGIRLEDVDHVFCPVPPTPLAQRIFERLEIPVSKCIWLDAKTAVRPDTLLVSTFPGTRRNYPRWVPQFVARRLPTGTAGSLGAEPLQLRRRRSCVVGGRGDHHRGVIWHVVRRVITSDCGVGTPGCESAAGLGPPV
jgi:hypothetical protein